MKKLLIILFILFSFGIYAIDIQPYWEIGEARFGGVFQNKKPKTDIEGSISAVKFFFYDLDTGLNFSLSPLYLDLGTEIKNDKNPNGIYIMSFINVELAFNTLYKLSDSNKYALNLFTSFALPIMFLLDLPPVAKCYRDLQPTDLCNVRKTGKQCDIRELFRN